MGGSATKPDAQNALKKSEENIVALMMPVYYSTEQLTDTEFEAAKACWASIVTNTAPAFLALRRDASFGHSTCITYFYHNFYTRLFDIHPMSKELFRDVNMQGKFLVKMLSLSLSERSDPEKYENTLIKLAEIHNERGIKAVECKHPLPRWATLGRIY